MSGQPSRNLSKPAMQTGKTTPVRVACADFLAKATKGITGTGLGLGLWVSKEIISKHGGIIQVHSRMQRGTVFSVVLPLQSSTVPTTVLPPSPGAVSHAEGLLS